MRVLGHIKKPRTNIKSTNQLIGLCIPPALFLSTKSIFQFAVAIKIHIMAMLTNYKHRIECIQNQAILKIKSANGQLNVNRDAPFPRSRRQ